MHLTDADLLGNLGLTHVLEEPQPHDRLLAFGKRREQLFDDETMLRELVARIFGSDPALDRGRLGATPGRIQRRGAVGPARVHRVENLIFSDVQMRRDLGDTRCAAQLLR